MSTEVISHGQKKHFIQGRKSDVCALHSRRGVIKNKDISKKTIKGTQLMGKIIFIFYLELRHAHNIFL